MTTSMKSPEYYRAEAAKRRARAQESFDRCDTDGFLAQYASNVMANLDDRKADIAEAGGFASFVGLYEGDRRVKAKLFETCFGKCWLIAESETAIINRRNGRFVPRGENSRVQKKLGLCERAEMAPAWAKLDGSGTGLGGQCWVATFRTGCQYGSDAQLIDE